MSKLKTNCGEDAQKEEIMFFSQKFCFFKVTLFEHHQIGFFLKQKELFKVTLQHFCRCYLHGPIQVFDTLNHYSLSTKLEVYALSAKSHSQIHSYLNKRLKNTNISCDFSLWKEIHQEFLNDLFLFHLYPIYVYQRHLFLCRRDISK